MAFNKKRVMITRCLLDDGTIAPYNACRDATEDSTKPYYHFKYLGSGVIYDIDGTRQEGKKRMHFYI